VTFAILGSGFGLYGYLPALIGCGERVVLSSRYRERFQSRKELARFADNIGWAEDEDAALASASGIVVALRPGDQAAWIPRCLSQPQLARLMLEKPLAPTPAEAVRLQKLLAASGRSFRIGYTFCGTPWATAIHEFADNNPHGLLSISWQFMAHHYRHDLLSWKRLLAEGGGAIRFYGIQLIAVLAEFGYREVVASQSFGGSEQEIVRWTATVAGKGLPDCRLVVDCKSDVTEFVVHGQSPRDPELRLFGNRDPFGDDARMATPDGLDSRVGLLREVIGPLLLPSSGPPAWYDDVLLLWQEIETRSVFSLS
jgi:predicted dehydrogenase